MSSDVVTSSPPAVSWAQRSATVFLTFNVECEKPVIEIEKKCISFKGTCAPEQILQEVVIPLYDEINPEKSSFLNKGRHIEVVLAKVKVDKPFWPTLTCDKKKHHWLKVDFNRWQDEDDSEDENIRMNDMFNSKLGGFDEFGDEIDETSSAEEDLPDLE